MQLLFVIMLTIRWMLVMVSVIGLVSLAPSSWLVDLFLPAPMLWHIVYRIAIAPMLVIAFAITLPFFIRRPLLLPPSLLQPPPLLRLRRLLMARRSLLTGAAAGRVNTATPSTHRDCFTTVLLMGIVALYRRRRLAACR